jgi:hypothetical protein
MKMEKAQVEEAFTYHAPTDEQVMNLAAVRLSAKKLALCILSNCPASADRTVALRKLREVVMIANASIVLEGLI